MARVDLEKRISQINAPIKKRIWGIFGKKRSPKEVYGLLSEFLLVEGKRLRPALCVASCQAVGGKTRQAISAAAAIEMFHNFTLIHDDIEDDSQLRRGKPCMHIKYGLPLAINAGDGLFMMVWREAMGIDAAHRQLAQKKLLIAFTDVLEGQAIELGWYRSKNWNVDEKQYYQMVRGKTGALIAASCEVGALLGGADERTYRALGRFGMGIGVGFQIIDDALNLIGDEKKYKKEIGGDIREGKRTLLTIWALRQLGRKDAKELKRILMKEDKGPKDVQKAIVLIRKSGAVEKVMARARKIVSSAMAELAVLPESEAKKNLEDMAAYITQRQR